MKQSLNLNIEEETIKGFKKCCIDNNTNVSEEVEKFMDKKIKKEVDKNE